ncbi:hemoglobin subunit beta-like [Leucoraja erinacea]|uniref:hemoglobin subunit beta-like n=1 Tax=Leucoraja erinaceus TaxID=7782 RepID=UPI002458C7EA|nr:hemoglobin subunit beta-like [Leucoraja erinacea]
MVTLTKEQADIIEEIWSHVDKKLITARALERVFAVYPWTTRLFSKLNGKFKATDVGVQEHAAKVVSALDIAVKNINNINFKQLSSEHQKIGVDTQNFRALGQTFIVELALQYKLQFTAKKHVATHKFFKQVAEALSSSYH